MIKLPIILMCSRCEYEWGYKGDKTGLYDWTEYTSCPRCHSNVKVKQ
jgi:hypothetical protein